MRDTPVYLRVYTQLVMSIISNVDIVTYSHDEKMSRTTTQLFVNLFSSKWSSRKNTISCTTSRAELCAYSFISSKTGQIIIIIPLNFFGIFFFTFG